MQQICDSFNEYLLPIFDKQGKLFLDFDDPVPENRELKLLENEKSWNKWKTINEIRDQEGLKPLEGGDELLIPLNISPLSLPKPEITEPTEGNQIEEQNQDENEEAEKMFLRLKVRSGHSVNQFKEQVVALKNRNIRIKQLKKQLMDSIRKFIKSNKKPRTIIHKKYTDIRKQDQVEKFIKTLMSNSDKYEMRMKQKLSAEYYQPQLNEILKKLGKGTKFLNKVKNIEKAIGDEYMFSQEKAVITGIDILTPLMKEILINQGKEAIETVSGDVAYSLLEEARKYLNKEPVKLSKTITETAYTRVRSSLAEGIKNGESIDELRKRVLADYEALETNQAEMIARTEVSRATNFATVDAYKQSGVVEGKEWIVTPDDRMCEFCQAMEGKKIGLSETYFKDGDTVNGTDGGSFKIDYSDVVAPPLHVNCRCALVAVKTINKNFESDKNKLEAEILEEIERSL
jgi:SPP1 gp7 family putative phage head morphogenesis protein